MDPMLGAVSQSSVTALSALCRTIGGEFVHAFFKVERVDELSNVITSRKPHISGRVRVGDRRKPRGTNVAHVGSYRSAFVGQGSGG